MSGAPERQAIISGIGQSEVGRRLFRDELDLTLDACLAAIADAGLTRDDIDGLTSYPGAMPRPAGFSGPGTPQVQDALRLELAFHRAGPEGAAQLSALVDAVLAVSTGLARHVLVYRTVTEASEQAGGRGGIGLPSGGPSAGRGAPRMGGDLQWLLPFQAYSAANWAAWHATRYFHQHGMTREQLSWIARNGRRHAAANPAAVYRDPMSLDDYLGARLISEPLGLYDCDAPVDGSTAFVVSHVDHAPDLDHAAVRFEAVGTALRGRPSWYERADLTTMAGTDAAAHLWSRTHLGPHDVDTAQLYDGFSWLTVMWLEALGFCGRGEAADFIDGGTRLDLDGDLPLNTWGGQLSGGRLHGFGFVHEAALQLRGQADQRQVPGAQVAVAAAGGGNLAGCLLFSRLDP